ncbi:MULTISPECIES: hypothetical protein [Pantoea]|uniref:Uncharacterized protein n=1 Tax=Pantoea brenneri TaxID=472694 RepID=A0ABU9MQN1_9GAMM|nr:hypothetical protein [Pantoea sp. 3.5.1]
MKNMYYISISKVANNHVVHNGTCIHVRNNAEDMILLGEFGQLFLALGIARNNFKSVTPCEECLIPKRAATCLAKKPSAPARLFPLEKP